METLFDVLFAAVTLLCALFLLWGAWLCLPLPQRKSRADGAEPTSSRKRLRSASGRLSASNR